MTSRFVVLSSPFWSLMPHFWHFVYWYLLAFQNSAFDGSPGGSAAAGLLATLLSEDLAVAFAFPFALAFAFGLSVAGGSDLLSEDLAVAFAFPFFALAFAFAFAFPLGFAVFFGWVFFFGVVVIVLVVAGFFSTSASGLTSERSSTSLSWAAWSTAESMPIRTTQAQTQQERQEPRWL